MALQLRHLVVCASQVEVANPHPHLHVARIGTGTPGKPDRHWLMTEVINAMGSGQVTFAMTSPSGKVLQLEIARCPHCRFDWILRSNLVDESEPDQFERLPDCPPIHPGASPSRST